MARILCLVCHYATPQLARIGGSLDFYLHCCEGVPGAAARTACPSK
jgi:hypothetical protein